jgi:hypothetical protein
MIPAEWCYARSGARIHIPWISVFDLFGAMYLTVQSAGKRSNRCMHRADMAIAKRGGWVWVRPRDTGGGGGDPPPRCITA